MKSKFIWKEVNITRKLEMYDFKPCRDLFKMKVVLSLLRCGDELSQPYHGGLRTCVFLRVA